MNRTLAAAALALSLLLTGCTGATSEHCGSGTTCVGPAPTGSASPSAPPDPDALPISELSQAAPLPSAALVAQTLAGPLADPSLGDQAKMHVLVLDALTGQVLLDRGGETPVTPASTIKMAVAAAALQAFGPFDTLTTSVVASAAPGADGVLTGDLVLVGGGDPTLTAGDGTGYDDVRPVTLASLAQAVRAAGVTRVTGRVVGDGTLFTGPRTADGWKSAYVSEGSVAPVTALEVDAGRPGPPVDRDARPRSSAPDQAAAAAFRAALTSAGVTVVGAAVTGVAPAGAVPVTTAQSPSVRQLVRRMLTHSDNDIAESLGRLVAVHAGQQATFAGAGAAVASSVMALTGSAPTLADVSGLSPLDSVQPATLAALVRLSVGPGNPVLRPVTEGLPVAGRTGTLVRRYLDTATAPAAGRVHAKTGTLAGVTAIAGWTTTAQGRLLVFDLTANGSVGEMAPQHALDVAVTALTGLTVPVVAGDSPSPSGSAS